MAVDWDLPIKPKKCSCLIFENFPHLNLSFSAAGVDHQIPPVTDVRDLGVTLGTNFTSSLHSRKDPTHPKVAFIPPYCAMLRPHLKFTMEAKCSTLRVDIDHPERVNGLQYGRLCQRNLFSPERRRLRAKLTLAFNIFKGEVDLTSSSSHPEPGTADTPADYY